MGIVACGLSVVRGGKLSKIVLRKGEVTWYAQTVVFWSVVS